MHCREILCTPCWSTRASEFPSSVNFSLRRTVAELRGFKVAQFSDFGLFSPYKTPKTYHPVTSLQPRGYIAEWLRSGSRRSKRVFWQRSFPATSGRGAGDSQTCPKFRLWQMPIPVQNSTIRHVKSGPKMSENRCTFPPNFFAPIPKITRQPHFWGPIIEKALCKSHVNGATKLKCYSYIGRKHSASFDRLLFSA